LADGDCVALRGCGIFGAVVLVAAGLAWFSRLREWRGGLAIDFCDSGGAGFCCGDQVHLGFRLDWARNAGADRSAAEARGGGVLSLRAESDVRGIFVGWFSLWALYGEANRVSLIVALVALAIAGLFVRLYEEPILRAKFGADYE
jgi:hypothetical protein